MPRCQRRRCRPSTLSRARRLAPGHRLGDEDDPVVAALPAQVPVQPDDQLGVLADAVVVQAADLDQQVPAEDAERAGDDEQPADPRPAGAAEQEGPQVLHHLHAGEPAAGHPDVDDTAGDDGAAVRDPDDPAGRDGATGSSVNGFATDSSACGSSTESASTMQTRGYRATLMPALTASVLPPFVLADHHERVRALPRHVHRLDAAARAGSRRAPPAGTSTRPNSSRSRSNVSSVEPSSMTMTSNTGYRSASIAWTALHDPGRLVVRRAPAPTPAGQRAAVGLLVPGERHPPHVVHELGRGEHDQHQVAGVDQQEVRQDDHVA